MVNHGFEPLSCHTKDNKIDICCFSARSKNKDWLDGNRDNVSRVELYFYTWTKDPNRRVDLVKNGLVTCSRHDMAEIIVHLALE